MWCGFRCKSLITYCRIKYQTEAEGKHKQEKRMAGDGCIPEVSASICHLNREVHKKVFEALCSYLQEVATENKDVLMLKDVNNYYCHLLHEFQRNTLEVTVQKLEKLIKCYGQKVCIVSENKRKVNILYGNSLSLEETVQKWINQWIKNLMMMRIYRLKRKHASQEKSQSIPVKVSRYYCI